MDERQKHKGFNAIWHDARAPLTAIEGYAELLLEGKFGDVTEQQVLAAKTVLNSSRYVREFWNHAEDYVLLILLPEAIDWDWQPLSLVDVVRESLERAYTYSYWREEPVALDIPGTLPPVRGDARWLSRAINYIIDPLSYELKHGTGIEASSPQDGRVLIRVHNQTTPIHGDRSDAELKDRLFSPGSRLQVAAAIVTAHGSQLEFERSGAEEIAFRFTLPLWNRENE